MSDLWSKGSLFKVYVTFGRQSAKGAPREIVDGVEKQEQAERILRVAKRLYEKDDLKELRTWEGKARRAITDLSVAFPKEGKKIADFVAEPNESTVIANLEVAEAGFREEAQRFRDRAPAIRDRMLAENNLMLKDADYRLEDLEITIWHTQYVMGEAGSDRARQNLRRIQDEFMGEASRAQHEVALAAVNKAIATLEAGKPVSERMFDGLRTMMRNLQAFNGLTDEAALTSAIAELRSQIDAQHAQAVRNDEGFLERFRRGLTMVVEAARTSEAPSEDGTFAGRAIEVG